MSLSRLAHCPQKLALHSKLDAVVRAPLTLVARDERVLAERPGSHRAALVAACGTEHLGRAALLDPGDQRVEQITRCRTRAAAAVAHTGRHEQPDERAGLLRAAHLLLHARVVVGRAVGINQRIGPAVPQDQLPAAIAERREVRIVGAEHRAELLHGLIPQLLVRRVRERRPVPLGILHEEVAEPVERDGEGPAGQAASRPWRSTRSLLPAEGRTRETTRPVASGPPRSS